MSFHEIVFPEEISYGAMGGPTYSTDIVVNGAGKETRNINREIAIREYDVSHYLKTQAQLDILYGFFHARKGRGYGFLFKDWADYLVTTANGRLGTGAVGTGYPTYQLYKRFGDGTYNHDQKIVKPKAGTLIPYRNASPITAGSGAGNYSIDTTTGILTMVADAESNASAITVGATTSVTLAANPGTLTNGQKLYLTGFAGADAALVNGIAHTINSVSGSGPYVFDLATDTSGKTITTGSGKGSKFPQSADALTWAGEFYYPCRFDIDKMLPSIERYQAYTWGQIPIVEMLL